MVAGDCSEVTGATGVPGSGGGHLGHGGYRCARQWGRPSYGTRATGVQETSAESCACVSGASDCAEVTRVNERCRAVGEAHLGHRSTEVPGSGGGPLRAQEHRGARQWGRPT